LFKLRALVIAGLAMMIPLSSPTVPAQAQTQRQPPPQSCNRAMAIRNAAAVCPGKPISAIHDTDDGIWYVYIREHSGKMWLVEVDDENCAADRGTMRPAS
jgi:hypothetical protein